MASNVVHIDFVGGVGGGGGGGLDSVCQGRREVDEGSDTVANIGSVPRRHKEVFAD